METKARQMAPLVALGPLEVGLGIIPFMIQCRFLFHFLNDTFLTPDALKTNLKTTKIHRNYNSKLLILRFAVHSNQDFLQTTFVVFSSFAATALAQMLYFNLP